MKRLVSLLLLAGVVTLSACGDKKSTPAHEAESGATHGEQGEESEHEEREGHVELSADAAKAAGIELATAGPAVIREQMPLYGKVQPNAERVREVTARYPGIIQSVSKRVGDSVRQGETLATVESNESLRTYPVTAPISGVITARNANPGETAGETPLFMVSDLSTVWVELSVFPKDLSKVQVGQTVSVRNVDSAFTADGKVSYIAALGQSESQTLSARVVIDNAARHWTPGLYVVGEVVLSELSVPVAVLSSALQTVEGATVVFVHSDDGFQATAVESGRSDGKYTEIRSGVPASAAYAATNSFVLKSELGKAEAGHEH